MSQSKKEFEREARSRPLFDKGVRDPVFGDALLSAALNLIVVRAMAAPDPIGRLDSQLKQFNFQCEQSFVANSNPASGQEHKRKYDA